MIQGISLHRNCPCTCFLCFVLCALYFMCYVLWFMLHHLCLMLYALCCMLYACYVLCCILYDLCFMPYALSMILCFMLFNLCFMLYPLCFLPSCFLRFSKQFMTENRQTRGAFSIKTKIIIMYVLFCNMLVGTNICCLKFVLRINHCTRKL